MTSTRSHFSISTGISCGFWVLVSLVLSACSDGAGRADAGVVAADVGVGLDAGSGVPDSGGGDSGLDGGVQDQGTWEADCDRLCELGDTNTTCGETEISACRQGCLERLAPLSAQCGLCVLENSLGPTEFCAGSPLMCRCQGALFSSASGLECSADCSI